MANTPEAQALPDPTPGATVLYTLKREDIDRIESDRIASLGYGNRPHVGDVVPVVAVRNVGPGLINGQAILDGNDRLWVASIAEGDEPGQWHRAAVEAV